MNADFPTCTGDLELEVTPSGDSWLLDLERYCAVWRVPLFPLDAQILAELLNELGKVILVDAPADVEGALDERLEFALLPFFAPEVGSARGVNVDASIAGFQREEEAPRSLFVGPPTSSSSSISALAVPILERRGSIVADRALRYADLIPKLVLQVQALQVVL